MADNLPAPRNNSNIPPIAPWDRPHEIPNVKSCKLCNSEYRTEAEELYDRTKDCKRVQKFLNDDRLQDISYGAVRNHLRFHYEMVSDNILIKEYANELQAWLGIQENQIDALQRTMAMIEREMMIIASHNDGLSLSERRKNNDTIVKLGTLQLSYRSKIEELQGDRKPVTLMINQLKIVLQEELQADGSGERKKVINNIIAKLQDSIGETMVPVEAK